jgi:type IV pilus assembly protein PilA
MSKVASMERLMRSMEARITFSDQKRKMNKNKKMNYQEKGFSLTELLISVSLIGILSSIAIPNYFSQLCRAKAGEAEATISSLMAIISAYSDETGTVPESWNSLDSITAIMTSTGTAKGDFSNEITLPNENYTVSITEPTGDNSYLYTLEAQPKKSCEDWDIKACLDLSTGASDIQRGNGVSPAKTPVCS